MATQVFNTPGVNLWTCPPGVASVKVEIWGGGGGGGGNNRVSDGAGGGGSGGYARLDVYPVLAGNVYTLNVGTGSPGGTGSTDAGTGGATWWISAATYQAPGGLGGHAAFSAAPRVGGAGGSSFTGTFTITRNGLSGGAGNNANTGGGGGGGGSGGDTGAGGAGTAGNATSPFTAAGGTAGTTNGATGGTGQAPGVAGSPGSQPGAGGGGSGDGGTLSGGKGGDGRVLLTFLTGEAATPNRRSQINRAVVAAWWAAAPILLWQNGFTIPAVEAQADLPFNRQWVQIVNRAWEPPDPPPQQGRRFFPHPTPAVEQTPFSRSWFNPVAAWQPETWAAQRAPRTAQEFVAPAEQAPFSRAAFAAITAQWTQDEWTTPQPRKLVQEAAAAVNDPIPRPASWLRTTLDSWAPQQIILWQNGILAQSGVDQVSHDRIWLHTVLAAWEPPFYDLSRRARVIEEPAAQVDNPPERSRLQEAIRQAWKPDDWAAQRAPTFPEGAAAPEAKTPFPRRWTQALEHWEQTLVPLWGGFGAQHADVPPPALRLWFSTVRASWEVTWSAQRARYVVQQGPVFDNPPVTERAWLRAVDQWEAPTWQAQTAKHTPPPTPDAPPITERVWLESVLRAWEPVPNEAQRRQPLTQFTPATVNDPPFGLRAWLPTVNLTWQPPDPEPKQLPRWVTESGPEVTPPVEPEVTPQTPAGKHRPRYYAIHVKGKDYVFASIDALLAFLNRQETAVENRAKEKAEFDAKRILRVGTTAAKPKPPRVAMRSAVPEIADYITLLQQRIDKLYRDALMSELMAQAEEEEDIKAITRML